MKEVFPWKRKLKPPRKGQEKVGFWNGKGFALMPLKGFLGQPRTPIIQIPRNGPNNGMEE